MISMTRQTNVLTIKDLNIGDKNYWLLKNGWKKDKTHVWESEFQILGNNYQSNNAK